MRVLKTFITTLTLGVGFASAALTPDCIASFERLSTNPDAQCLNIDALLQLIGSEDVPGTIQNWLTGFCGNGECSQEALGNIVVNITSGCVEAIAPGTSETKFQTLITHIVQQAYPAARRIACLRDTTTGDFCPVELLKNLESTIGKLHGTDDIPFFNLAHGVDTLLESNETPPEMVCTQCVASTFAVLGGEMLGEQLSAPEVTGPLSDTCGADFLTGSIGENVEQTASTAQFTANNTGSGGDDTDSARISFPSATWILTAMIAAFTLIL